MNAPFIREYPRSIEERAREIEAAHRITNPPVAGFPDSEDLSGWALEPEPYAFWKEPRS